MAEEKKNRKKNSEDDEITWKKKLVDEKEKIAAMDKKQKWSYYKTYYLVPTVVTAFVMVCIIWFLYDAVFSRKNVLYTGALVGCQVSDAGRDYLTEGFREVLGGRQGKDSVILSEDLWIAFSEEDVKNYQSMDSSLYVNIAAGDFNYMLIDGAMVNQYAELNALADLSGYVHTYRIAEEDLFLTEDDEVVAIKLSADAVERMEITSLTGEVYLAIVDVKRNIPYDELFIEYIMR